MSPSILARLAVVALLLTSAAVGTAAAAQGTPPRPATAAVGTAIITGRVVDSASTRPMVAAQVSIAGTRLGAMTAENGRFTITGVPAGSLSLRVILIGYAPVSRIITVGEGATVTADFAMAQQATQLTAVVAVGYGTQKRQDVTGSVSSVSGAAIKEAPVTAVANALQGRAPGVQVISNSGAPGGGASVRVRGTNSISANSEPLYVIDGVPFGQGSTAEGTLNPLAGLDPQNIESMEVLKDASATAIYGARGANGVVLITTKRGERGATRLSFETSYGTQTIANRIATLDAKQFMTLANEANANAGIALRYTQANIDTAKTYDYLGLITRTAPQATHGVTISGGDERTRFLLSGSYQGQDGILLNTDFTRYGARLNFDQTISRKFRVGTSLSGTRVQQNVSNAEDVGLNGGVYAALNFAPNVAPKDANGNWVKLAVTSDQVQNPLAGLSEIKNPRRTTRIIDNTYAEYDLLDNLRLRSTLGLNLGFENTPYFAPSTVFPGGAGGVARRYSNDVREVLNENTATWQRKIGPGSLELLGGFSVQTSHLEEQQAESQLLPSNSLGFNNLGAGALVIAPTSNVVDWSILSYLSRVNYNIGDRYLLTASARRDGSSRFGANNKWALFPSAAFAWRVINEGFLKKQTLLSDFKVRVSVGRTGNQAVTEYTSLARLGTNFIGLGTSPAANVALAPTPAAPNPNLKWETQDQTNIGMDIGFLNNKLSFTADAYQIRTTDLLLNVALPAVTGFATQLQNVGSVKNNGLEFGVNATFVETEQFGWRGSFNMSRNRNTVTSLGTRTAQLLISAGAGSGANFIVRPGLPLSSMFGFKVLGLWQQGDQCNLNAAVECTPGEYKLQDTDGNKVINDNDRVVLANADPDWYGGFTQNLRWKGLTLDAFFTYTIGNEVLNLTKQRNGLVRGVYNERADVLNRWTPSNTNTMVPRANASRVGARFYSTLIEDGSFVRLQTLTLGYQLPKVIRGRAESARVYVTGQNLFTSTKYTGFDPEVNRWGGNSQLRGVDQSTFPRAKVWNVGFNLNY
jgi:TonB-linked SusC/RagA family outer membrane protein